MPRTIFRRLRIGKYAIIAAATAAVVAFLMVSNGLVRQLADQERERMALWAEATHRLVDARGDTDVDFLLSIISQNTTIPVLVADDSLRITEHRNFPLPDGGASQLSAADEELLAKRLAAALHGRTMAQMAASADHCIALGTNPPLYIYYEDSALLRKLSLYPYVEVGVILVLALMVYVAARYTRRAEQNRVWVGLSKETAHQLGTPISSLMAWTQYMEAEGADPAMVEEMDKDVARLRMIAERFSKIGSVPELARGSVAEAVGRAADYMRRRISGRVEVQVDADEVGSTDAMICEPLLAWVIENLMKNAVDAMGGAGRLHLSVSREADRVVVEVADTGRGIPRKLQRRVFRAGFTTKTRGWGLGLALARRIVADYHNGRIFVKESAPGQGTTFRIELPALG